MRLVLLIESKTARPVWVNPDKVTSVRAMDGVTHIDFDASHFISLFVEESPYETAQLLTGEPLTTPQKDEVPW